jgi:hypothetical protein
LPLTIPSTIYPVFESSLLVGREQTIDTAPSAFTGIPCGALQTNQRVSWLEDMNLRGSQTKVYDLEQGAEWAEVTVPESPMYGDTIGHILFSALGDYTATGTAGTPTWTTSGALSAGATSIAVTTGSVATSGTFIQVDTGTTAEIVTVGTGSTSTNIVLNAATPLRFNHLTSIAVTTVVAPFTHVFSLLNPASSTGNTSAQPPTYTWLHRNFIATSADHNADQYSYTRVTDLNLTAKKDGWVSWDAKAVAYLRGYPSSDYPPSFTTVKANPSWKSVISLASTTNYTVSEIKIGLSREMDIVTTADGSQNPYVIAAGPVTATFNMDFDAQSDETQLSNMLNNTQPTLSYVISNGLSGASTVSMTIAAQLAGYKNAPLSPVKSLWGYKVSGDLIANTTNAGNSGGYSPCQVTLVNAVSSY